jgi:hypothetical protein
MAKKPDIESLRARLRDALLTGTDTASIRESIAEHEREQRETVDAQARADAAAAAERKAAIEREATARAAASRARLQSLLQSFNEES